MARFCLFLAAILCFSTRSLVAQPADQEKLCTTAEEKLAAPKQLLLWVKQLNDPDAEVRQEANEFFDADVESINLWGLDLDQESIEARAAFRKRYRPVIPALVQYMRGAETSLPEGNTEATVSFHTVLSILDSLGTDAQAVIPELKRMAHNDKLPCEERIRCAVTLLALTPDDQPVGPLFLKVLDSMPANIRQQMERFCHVEKLEADKRESAEQTRNFGIGMSSTILSVSMIRSGHTKSEIPTLSRIAQGPYPTLVRAIAVSVLGELSFDARAAVPGLRKLLNDEEPLIRMCAVGSRLEIEDDESLLPELIPFLKLEQKERKEYEESFREYFADQKKLRKDYAEMAEGELGEYFLQSVRDALQNGRGYQQREAIQILGYIGPNAKDALPELRNALQDPDEDTRRMAAEAMKKIEIE